MSLRLDAAQLGDGPPIVLLHGLSATKRYVVHRSKVLPRAGYRLVMYDARGHGESAAPGDPDAYEYSHLAADLGQVMDEHEIERAALVGVSMGAHTALRFALEHPERVSALVAITPAFTGDAPETGPWDRMADALEEGGVEGFVSAWGAEEVAPRYREAALDNARQRLSLHRDLSAVARALRVVPRSTPFRQGVRALKDVEAPALVVGSRDDADPVHPLAVAREYAETMPHARLLVEDEGKPPLAWQGSRLSRAISEYLEGL